MPLTRQAITREEYLALEIRSDNKHEFYQGEIFAMTGGTFNHSLIAGNIFRHLGNSLANTPCQPMNSDMRISTPAGLDTYPDISDLCRVTFFCKQKNLTRPTLLYSNTSNINQLKTSF